MSLQCLKAEDMANAVIYVLSAPPHVQVGWSGLEDCGGFSKGCSDSGGVL